MRQKSLPSERSHELLPCGLLEPNLGGNSPKGYGDRVPSKVSGPFQCRDNFISAHLIFSGLVIRRVTGIWRTACDSMIGGAHKAFDDAGLDFKKKKISWTKHLPPPISQLMAKCQKTRCRNPRCPWHHTKCAGSCYAISYAIYAISYSKWITQLRWNWNWPRRNSFCIMFRKIGFLGSNSKVLPEIPHAKSLQFVPRAQPSP